VTTETRLTSLPASALAPSRKRPYFARTTASRDRAERVQAIVQELPVTPTIRQVYYILVGEHLIEKTDAGYKSLVRQLGMMRKGGELPYTALIDGTRDRKLNRTFTAPSAVLAYARDVYRRDPWADQAVVPEVWAEADTLSQMLSQAAMPLSVPVVVCRGNSSLTQLYNSAGVIAKRWENNHQRTAVLYAGDFDPAGMDMSTGLHGRLMDVGAPGLAFTVERVAITPDQIAAYRLPPHSPKVSDARTPQFIATYGFGCVEADALPPAVLIAVVENAIRTCITDSYAWSAVQSQEEQDRQALDRVCEEQGFALDLEGGRPIFRKPDHLATVVNNALQAMIGRVADASGLIGRTEMARAVAETQAVLRVLERLEKERAGIEGEEGEDVGFPSSAAAVDALDSLSGGYVYDSDEEG